MRYETVKLSVMAMPTDNLGMESIVYCTHMYVYMCAVEHYEQV